MPASAAAPLPATQRTRLPACTGNGRGGRSIRRPTGPAGRARRQGQMGHAPKHAHLWLQRLVACTQRACYHCTHQGSAAALFSGWVSIAEGGGQRRIEQRGEQGSVAERGGQGSVAQSGRAGLSAMSGAETHLGSLWLVGHREVQGDSVAEREPGKEEELAQRLRPAKAELGGVPLPRREVNKLLHAWADARQQRSGDVALRRHFLQRARLPV
eukprot:365961-Chlamydomonas_euryale.AAC.13